MEYLQYTMIILLAATSVKCSLEQTNANETRTPQEYGEQIKISADDGKLLSTVDVFFNEGYQIEKPTDRNKCLISQITENATCFEEVPISNVDMIPDNIAALCKGRGVLTLVPIECNKEDHVDTDEMENTGDAQRQRRSTYSSCYRYRRVYRQKCRSWCCLHSTFCFHYCRSCETVTSVVQEIITGYYKPY